jgi:membrane associated rhomboid family serine protease
MAWVLFLAAVLVLGYRATPEDQRVRLLQIAEAICRRMKDMATQNRLACEPFNNALRGRTRWVLLTPSLVTLNVTIFVFMLFGSGALNDPSTLVAWGGNLGPRTTNGEWWRLVAALFVHAGLLHIIASAIGLVPVGLILERLVGWFAVATVYVAAGVFAGLVNLSNYPLSVSVGASGAVFGLYGLLLASASWGWLRSSDVTIPLPVLKWLAPSVAVFVLYCLTSDSLGIKSEFIALVAGFVSGLVVARRAGDRKPAVPIVSATMAAMLVIAIACAGLLHGITDVRPEIDGVVALEDRTARAYQTARDGFGKGRVTSEALAQLIDGTILPEFQAADRRLKAIHGVPHEQAGLVADAERYLELRSESWRLRAEGLRSDMMHSGRQAEREQPPSDANSRVRAEKRHTASMLISGRVESTERASLEALHRVRSFDQGSGNR